MHGVFALNMMIPAHMLALWTVANHTLPNVPPCLTVQSSQRGTSKTIYDCVVQVISADSFLSFVSRSLSLARPRPHTARVLYSFDASAGCLVRELEADAGASVGFGASGVAGSVALPVAVSVAKMQECKITVAACCMMKYPANATRSEIS